MSYTLAGACGTPVAQREVFYVSEGQFYKLLSYVVFGASMGMTIGLGFGSAVTLYWGSQGATLPSAMALVGLVVGSVVGWYFFERRAQGKNHQ